MIFAQSLDIELRGLFFLIFMLILKAKFEGKPGSLQKSFNIISIVRDSMYQRISIVTKSLLSSKTFENIYKYKLTTIK